MIATEIQARLCEQVNVDRMIDYLTDMIAIPSMNPFQSEPRPEFREQELAEYYADRMSDLDLDVGIREVVAGRPNVWGILKGKGDGPSVMLSGHLDTVGIEGYEDGLTPRVEDNRVYGRGACDMKDALAGYLEVVRVIRDAGIELRGDLVLTGIVDEEDQMIGSKNLGQYGPWADYGIIGEPSDMAICPAHKGQVGYLVKSRGKAVHSSKPEGGVNAIEGMSHVISALERYQRKLLNNQPHPLCGHGRCCPSVIHGGTIVSTVPDYCELEIDRRTLPGETREDVYRELLGLIESVTKEHSQFEFEITGPTIDVQPLDIPRNNPIVEAVVNAFQPAGRSASEVTAFFGGTDAPHFGFPTLVCGAGSLQQAHSTNEYVEIEDMLLATRIYLVSVLNLAT